MKTLTSWILLGAFGGVTLACGGRAVEKKHLRDSSAGARSENADQIFPVELPAGEPGSLAKLRFAGRQGHYTLNGAHLRRVSSGQLRLSTANEAYKVRITFLKTIRISRGKPLDSRDHALLENWAHDVPLVARILKEGDVTGSLKLLFYDLIKSPGGQHLQIQEEVTYLWSEDPADSNIIGNPISVTPMPFPEHLVDLQYRGLPEPAERLFGKIILQTVSIQNDQNRFLLAGFVIVSTPNGEYEFYLVPKICLEKTAIKAE